MTQNKDGSFRLIFIFMIVTMIIAFNWDKWTWMKDGIHFALNPTLGALLNWNLTIGMLICVLLISIITTVLQKYTTDQTELKRIKKLQKELQKKANELKHDPKKAMEVQKELMPLSMKQMKLGMRTIVYTGIPFVLLFRWFNDYFLELAATTGETVKFFGFLSWFWFYLIFTLVFSSILKKKFDVV
ncbi:DUF106 domain-containing protein [archaeon]|nr:DUF106 domain-containing protein [archaeon]